MRYLYGDSAPFPHSFNFLATLDTFMAAAAQVVKLESEARVMETGAAQTATARVKSLEELETFHAAVMRAVQDSARRTIQPETQEYVRQLIEQATRFLEDAKRNVAMTNEREQGAVRADVDRRRAEIRMAIESFLVNGRLPTLDATISMRFDGHNVVLATHTHPEGIVASFQLATHKLAEWTAPRRVAEFAHGVNLMVGLKRSLFRRDVKPELVHIDDYVVSGFDLTDSTAEIRLRRKIAERDALVFSMRREETELWAEVSHPYEEGPEALPAPVDAGDKVHLTRLWQNLRMTLEPLLAMPDRLMWLKLEGEDVFEHELAIMFIERIVRFLAPTVNEIARRSPNPMEFSLKTESDAGRREEIYVRKEDLLARLGPLSERERGIFAPLGLVPGAPRLDPGASVIVDEVEEIHFDEWEK